MYKVERLIRDFQLPPYLRPSLGKNKIKIGSKRNEKPVSFKMSWFFVVTPRARLSALSLAEDGGQWNFYHALYGWDENPSDASCP